MMKKVLLILLALSLAIGVGCAFADDALPPFQWQGEDPVIAAVISYMQANASEYEIPEGGVMIPTPIILKTEPEAPYGDAEEVTVYGNFWIFTYAKEGKILKTGPSGENPGVMKLEKKDGVWTVASAEFAEDGEGYAASIEKFAGGDKELEAQYALTNGSSEDSVVSQFQRAAVVEYVAANGLDIEAYQDQGWDPVSVTD